MCSFMSWVAWERKKKSSSSSSSSTFRVHDFCLSVFVIFFFLTKSLMFALLCFLLLFFCWSWTCTSCYAWSFSSFKLYSFVVLCACVCSSVMTHDAVMFFLVYETKWQAAIWLCRHCSQENILLRHEYRLHPLKGVTWVTVMSYEYNDERRMQRIRHLERLPESYVVNSARKTCLSIAILVRSPASSW